MTNIKPITAKEMNSEARLYSVKDRRLPIFNGTNTDPTDWKLVKKVIVWEVSTRIFTKKLLLGKPRVLNGLIKPVDSIEYCPLPLGR